MSEPVIYRPECPIGPKGTPLDETATWDNWRFYHRVFHEDKVIVAYNPFYFVTVNEIVSDLLDLMKTEAWQERFVQFEDFVLWGGPGVPRVLAVVHSIKDFESEHVERRVVLFNEAGNELRHHVPFDGYPSRDEWIANGRGPLDWLDPKEHPERAHSHFPENFPKGPWEPVGE